MLQRLFVACIALAVLCGCGQPEGPAPSPSPTPKTTELKTIHRAMPSISAGMVSPIYLQQWGRARNRDRCAPIAPQSLGDYGNARARPAHFSDGWAVAYDLPKQRSAFGVAGTGADATAGNKAVWLREKQWPDGRVANYGLEGGVGPTLLAYLTIPGQSCLYNVWSNISFDHLEYLLDQLRLVNTRP